MLDRVGGAWESGVWDGGVQRRWQKAGHQAAAATAGGWGSRARCAGTAGAAGQSETVQPPLNLKVAC